MPYIDPMRRVKLIEFKEPPQDSTELTFLFCYLINNYMKFKGEKAKHYIDVMGSLETTKSEVYRRLIAPYEDKKIKQNGDVFEL